MQICNSDSKNKENSINLKASKNKTNKELPIKRKIIKKRTKKKH